MDVGINLHDLRGSGRLGAFARSLGVGEHEAIGVLADAWAETQDRELCLVTQEQFVSAVGLRFDDPVKVFAAMKRALLVVPVETPEAGLGPTEHWLIRGNEKHVAKLRAYRASAVAGGKASAAKRHPNGAPKPKRSGAERLTVRSSDGVPNGAPLGTRPVNRRAPEPEPWLLVTGISTGEEDLRAPAPDLSPATHPEIDPRSSVSSDAKNEIALTATPSAAAVALSVLDVKPPKRKERSPEQKKRSVANALLYRQLYARAEGHEPSGLDASFYGAMAKFSDKHADNTETILRWVFASPDPFFRNKGWPLELIIAQAPKLWSEANNPRKAIENLAAPRKQQQLSLAANNEVEFDAFLERHGEAR